MGNQYPTWAEELRAKYLRGEASQFVLYGNVFDLLLHEGSFLPLNSFLETKLLANSKDTILSYNPASGVKFIKKPTVLPNIDELITAKRPAEVLPALEKVLNSLNKVAIIFEYAETIVPAVDWSLASESDRAAIVTLHRWSLSPNLQSADNIVILVTEVLNDLNPKLLANPKISAIQIPFPERSERRAMIKKTEPHMDDEVLERMAEHTAGLKLLQIESILGPSEIVVDDYKSRVDYIYKMLTGEDNNRKQRAERFASLTQGMTQEEIQELIAPDGEILEEKQQIEDPYQQVMSLIFKRKQEIIEKECFGLVEIVHKNHNFDAVGGMDEIKKILRTTAQYMRSGESKRVPMGMLFVGPMGTGKTFLAEAFANETGFTAIKLKNFRSKWVGSTEANLEKILSIIQAIGQVIVILDEGDRSFGSDGDNDGGVNSRVIARLKEFMSDTTNRGRVLFIMMTNRPDKLDVDIKRAGRLDKKIPFFYPEQAQNVESVLQAVVRRNRFLTTIDFEKERKSTSEKLLGYSNADLEAIVLMASEKASMDESDEITVEHLKQAIDDYLPSKDADMLEYMELLAVFEASSRSLLPEKYRKVTPLELQKKLEAYRMKLRS